MKDAENSVRGRSRALGTVLPDEKKKRTYLPVIGALVILLAGAASYVGMAQRYRQVYLPNTQINGLDASGKTAEEMRRLITEETRAYVLKLEERGGKTEEITGEAIDLHPEFDGTLEVLLTKQKPYEWGVYQLGLRSAVHAIETMTVYEEEALQKELEALSCLRPEEQTEPQNAAISSYVSGQGYSVIPEQEGSVVIKEALFEAAVAQIQTLQETLSLEEAGVYQEPEFRRDDETLIKALDTMNQYAGVTITYQFGEKTELLNGDRIQEWISLSEDGTVDLDASGIASYVEELAATYNTSNKAKTLKTSYGTTIQVTGGSYGWRINQSEEAKELEALIRSGESQTREPVYGQTAASHGEQDYGSTYVELNLTAQHLFFYKEGKLVVESDFVSGNLARGWGTPAGTYPLTYKQKNAVLKGENYRTPVDYWMPFNGGIGMHDATWRSSFGGTIYKTNGSHGCINLPHQVAKTIYENISAGIPVICYHLSGTESKTTSASKKPETAKPAEETTAPETVPEAGIGENPEAGAAEETTSVASGELSVKPETGEISMIEQPVAGQETQPVQNPSPEISQPSESIPQPSAEAGAGSGPASDVGESAGSGPAG